MLFKIPVLFLFLVSLDLSLGTNEYFKSCRANLRQNDKSWTRNGRHKFGKNLQRWILSSRYGIDLDKLPIDTKRFSQDKASKSSKANPSATTAPPAPITTSEPGRKKREVLDPSSSYPGLRKDNPFKNNENTKYWGEVGELKLLNFQDKMAYMKCPCYFPTANRAHWLCGDKSAEVFWKMWGFENQNKPGYENYDFNNKNIQRVEANLPAGEPRGYYRELRCQRTVRKHKDKIPWRRNTTDCYHFYNVFTRPIPDLDLHVQFTQGGSMKFKCEPSEMMFKRSYAMRKTGSIPVINPPYQIMWIGPKALEKEQNKIDSCNEKHESSPDKLSICLREIRRAVLRNDTYIQDKYRAAISTTTFKVSLPEAKGDLKYPTHPNITCSGEKCSITLERKEVKVNDEDLAEGVWECVIIDGNGLDSRLDPEYPLDEEIKFKGQIMIHIRKMWVIILAGCLLVFFLLLLVPVILFCPDNKDDKILQDWDDKDAAVMAAIHKFEAQADEDESTMDESSINILKSNKVAPAPESTFSASPSKSNV